MIGTLNLGKNVVSYIVQGFAGDLRNDNEPP
jgi:hypothetical protein